MQLHFRTMIQDRILIRASTMVALSAAMCLVTAVCCAQQLPQINRSHSFGPDQCGPADPSYIKTANETGGVPLFLQRSEAAKSFHLVRESTRENVSTVLWASAKLIASPHTFDIPVDSVTERITFTFSVDTKGTKLVLRQPFGQEVVAGSPATEDTELNCGRVITVVKPQTGMWHAEISGSGTFWLQAQAQSEIYFLNAEFVELGGRPGHQGLFRIHGQPIAGKPATLQVSMSAAPTETTEFALVSARGDVLEKLHLKTVDHDREFLEVTGDVNLPDQPFRIAVSGRDSKGMPYQRFNSPLFHAESVQVTPTFTFDQLAPGERKAGEFEVRNFGPSRTFKVTVTDVRKLVTSVEPKELALPANGSGTIRVQLTVPAPAQTGFGDDLVVVAASTSGAPTTNSAIVHLSVADKATPEDQR